jgi:hypothetical protein
MANQIETNAKNYEIYNVTDSLLLNILKIDNVNLKKQQNLIENSADFIKTNNLYSNINSNYTFYTNSKETVYENYTIDVSYNIYISNFDNYFESQTYLLNNTPQRLFYLISPKYNSMNIFLTDFEKLFLNLFTNGINFISISNQNLIQNLISKIYDFSDNIVKLLFYVNLSAIFFTLLFSIVLLIMFLKLFSKQDEILQNLIKLDTICVVKMLIMCDKFLYIINQTPNDCEAFRKFYCIFLIN